MEIEISQNGTLYEYAIYSQGQQIRYTQFKLSLLPRIPLYAVGSSTPILTIAKKYSPLLLRYDIIYPGDRVASFKTTTPFKTHYQLRKGVNLYDIYQHHGRRYSVFQDNTQIAWWDKEAVSQWGVDHYKIIADDDCDLDLVIAFCLIVDNATSDDHHATVTYDLGNIGRGAREFDPTWQPKTIQKDGQ